MIFVIGCGRTGTHWLGRSLEQSGLRVLWEDHATFQRSVELALYPSRRRRLLADHIAFYQTQSPMTVCKAHPNLFVARDLARAVPDAIFLYTHRDVRDTVRSMLHHRGTRRWAIEADLYPEADDFLGRSNPKLYAELGVAGRCAMRVASHALEARSLHRLGIDMLVHDYDAAVVDPEASASALSAKLGRAIELIAPRRRALPELTRSQVREVERALDEVLADQPGHW